MNKIIGIIALLCAIVMSSHTLYAADGKKSAAVVYFSATGTTKAVAEKIAASTGADIYEIVPKDAYSSADLNYHDDDCRANREMKDRSARPAIANDLAAVAAHDVVFIGYPIWWDTAPRIISTFIEAYDLKGAEIHLFCTSGSSGIDTSISDLRGAYPSLDIKNGRRLNGASASDIDAWIRSF